MIEIKKEVTDKGRFLRWQLGDDTVDKLDFNQRVIAYACLMSGKKCFVEQAEDAATDGYCYAYDGAITEGDMVYERAKKEGWFNEDAPDYFVAWLLEHVNYEQAGKEYEWCFDDALIRVWYDDELGDFNGVVEIDSQYKYCFA